MSRPGDHRPTTSPPLFQTEKGFRYRKTFGKFGFTHHRVFCSTHIDLQLGTTTMELSAEINTRLAKGLDGAKVTVQLMCVLAYHRQITIRGDIFAGLCDLSLCRFTRTWLVSKLRINVTLNSRVAPTPRWPVRQFVFTVAIVPSRQTVWTWSPFY